MALAGKDAREQTRDMFRGKLRRGELDDTVIELEIADAAHRREVAPRRARVQLPAGETVRAGQVSPVRRLARRRKAVE